MNQEYITGLSQAWKDICDQYTENEHLAALQFIQRHVENLVTVFYEKMSSEPESAEFFLRRYYSKKAHRHLKKMVIRNI